MSRAAEGSSPRSSRSGLGSSGFGWLTLPVRQGRREPCGKECAEGFGDDFTCPRKRDGGIWARELTDYLTTAATRGDVSVGRDGDGDDLRVARTNSVRYCRDFSAHRERKCQVLDVD